MKIAVIGAGTVGVLSVCHFLGYTKKDVQVTCIHNPKKNILGIGESSTTLMPLLLWQTLNFNFEFDGQDLQYTYKAGVKFKNWRDYDFVNPMIPPSYAIHFDNFKLAEVIFKKVYEKYSNRFSELNIDIETINQNNEEVVINNNYKFDYVIDCRGFPKDYTNYTMVDLPINHCLVHSVNEPGDWNFTYHIAHNNGWMFGIPLQKRQGWGYLYNDEITSKKDALDNFSEITNKNINIENIREFTFKPFKAKKFIDGRILLNGNAALFFEPIEAISGAFYDELNRLFYEYIFSDLVDEKQVNNHADDLSDKYLNFVSYLYQGGSIYNTDFWKYAQKICTDNLQNDKWFETIKNIKYKKYFPFSPEAWYIMDKYLYNSKTFKLTE